MRRPDSVKVFLSEVGLLLSFCLNAETLSRDFRTEHITLPEILLSSSSLAIEERHPLPQTSPPSISLSLLSLFPLGLHYLGFFPSQTISIFGLSLNYPGTLYSLFIFAQVSGSDTWIV